MVPWVQLWQFVTGSIKLHPIYQLPSQCTLTLALVQHYQMAQFPLPLCAALGLHQVASAHA